MTLSAQLRPDTELQGAGGPHIVQGRWALIEGCGGGGEVPHGHSPSGDGEHISGPMPAAGAKAPEQHPGPAPQSSRGGRRGLGTAGWLTDSVSPA